MNEHPKTIVGHSTCPHDCPSCCALDVDVIGGQRIGRVRGAKDNSYTAGVICAKVARYAERIHHPDRLTKALRRTGAKGEGAWQEISVAEALTVLGGRLFEGEFCERHSGTEDLCTHSVNCSIRSLWRSVQSVVDQLLRLTTL
ncbi:MAG TPA: hypothetical protein VK862_00360, partial [Afifellaceae bacterium]|nr:hypothetical protein [Afifellaceae bacterium]